MRIVIVEDSVLLREGIARLLNESGHEVVGQLVDAGPLVPAVEELHPDLIVRLRPDLVFLDVQMVGCDGFETLMRVGRDAAPVVIFVTAYDEYALRAFEVHAVDYLLKPFSAERLAEALARARGRLGRGERGPSPEVAAAARPSPGYATRILVRDGSRVHVIPLEKIDSVQAQDDYVCFSSEGKEYLKEQTLGEVEASLDPARFVRIHRSYLISLDRLVRVELDERENRVAVLTTGRRLPVSRTGYQRLNRAIE